MGVRMRGFARYTRLEDALKLVLSSVRRLEHEVIPFERAMGRVLAEDIVSRADVPPFDRSAVDGYAVRASDTFGASERSPVELKVVGSVGIGRTPEVRVQGGEAVKLMTGARMPEGADAVVMVENTELDGDRLKVFTSLTPGRNVSARGEDVKAGELVLRRGLQLRPQDIGMLASTGNVSVKVSRRPRVAILATGSELVSPGEPLGGAQIVESNSYSISAAVEGCGGEAVRLGRVPDERGAAEGKLREAPGFDAVITTGGISVGEHDILPDIVAELGELLFHGVAIRPGSPTAFGVVGGSPVSMLPGFPVASLVAFDLLVRPALRFMQGLPADRGFPRVKAELARKVSSSLGRVDVARVSLVEEDGELLAEPIRVVGAGILSSMTRADGFILVPENVEVLEEGEVVEVELYSASGGPSLRLHDAPMAREAVRHN